MSGAKRASPHEVRPEESAGAIQAGCIKMETAGERKSTC